MRRYNRSIIAENQRVKDVRPPSVSIEKLAFDAACHYHRTDNTDRFIHVAKLLSHASLQQFVQDMQQKENVSYKTFGLLQEAGKLSLIDAAKLYYRSGKLEQAVLVSEHCHEKTDREFVAHCKSCLTSRQLKEYLSQSKLGTSTIDAEVFDEGQLLVLAKQYSEENLSDGEIDTNFLLFRLTKNTKYLFEAYKLSVKCKNIVGEALSIHLLRRRDLDPSAGVSIMNTLQTVQRLCTFCESLKRTIATGMYDRDIKLFERQLNFLGVFLDKYVLEKADARLWFPTGVEVIHLWELPGAHRLKSKSKRQLPVECNKVFLVIIGALLQIACDVMVNTTDVEESQSVGTSASAVVGIMHEINSLVDATWCPDFLVGAKCAHEVHNTSIKKEDSVSVTIHFISALGSLINLATNCKTEKKQQTLSIQIMNKLETILRGAVKSVIKLCYPGLHCKLRGSENRAMIQWAKKLDDGTMRTLGYRTTSQAQLSFSTIDLFNVWRAHCLAGKKPQLEFQNWLKKAQKTFFRYRPDSDNHNEWLQVELSKSLVQFQFQGQSKHCFALWLWIEFIGDVYWFQNFTSALQALFYLVSFELRLDVVEIEQERSDNILMLTEIGVAVALLVLSKTGKAVVIPSPLVAGYMVLDAAVNSNNKEHQLRIEESVQRLLLDFNVVLWARHFLLLAAMGVMQYLEDKKQAIAYDGSSACDARSVRRLVIVLTLMCNADSGSTLRRQCKSMLCGSMKRWLSERTSYTTASGREVHTATQAMACLREVLSRYRPQQWLYYADWSRQSRYLLHRLTKPSDYQLLSRLLETQWLGLTFPEELPTTEDLRTISFPYISSLKLPQLWDFHASTCATQIALRQGHGSDDYSPRQKKTKFSADRTQSLPPRFRRPIQDRKSDASNDQSSDICELAQEPSGIQSTNVEDTGNDPTNRFQIFTETKSANNLCRKDTVSSASIEHDKEMSVDIEGHEARFSKWLQAGPFTIDKSGGEIVSPGTDNYVRFPPDAVSEGESIQVSYAQFRLNNCWQSDDGCLLDMIQLLPHDAKFHKRVDVFIRHHVIIDESCKVIVMRSTVQADQPRSWHTIAHLSAKDRSVSVRQSEEDDDTLVWLEENYVGITSKHFCEDCVVVKGKIKLAVQCYQLLSPEPESDRFRTRLCLSCPSKKRMKNVKKTFAEDYRAVRKDVQYVLVKTDERASLVITLRRNTEGWQLIQEENARITVEYEDIENHAQNEQPPQHWNLWFEKGEMISDSNRFEMSIRFSSAGVKDVSLDVCGTSASPDDGDILLHANDDVSLNETSVDTSVTVKLIRKLYCKVSHKWKAIARALPGSQDVGLQDYEIDKIANEYKNNSDECCYQALTQWMRKHEGTQKQLIFVVLEVDLGTAAVEVFGAEAVTKCKQKLAN